MDFEYDCLDKLKELSRGEKKAQHPQNWKKKAA
jgi:hypothetical protein